MLKDVVGREWFKEGFVRRIFVSIVEFPLSFYHKYGIFLTSLCTDQWKNTAMRFGIYGQHNIERFCNVNSPLHYLLVDILLHYVVTSLPSCKWIITTNADNFYSPGFFKIIAETDHALYDIVMVNMVSRGVFYETTPNVGSVDLGAYAVNSSCLF